jgi:methionyl-tRNA formyltransferase
LHASILPNYRGASPIQQSLLNDDSFSGVTAMKMDMGLDSGDILGYKYITINKNTIVSELFNSLALCASQLTIEVLEKLDFIVPKKQNLSLVSHCKKIIKQDALVTFSSAIDLYNTYRAFKLWPEIFLDTGLKIKECFLNDGQSVNNDGTILVIEPTSIIIGCTLGSVKITNVQPSSKKRMDVVDYIRGKRLKVGDTFS